MPEASASLGSLVVRSAKNGDPYYEAKWRDSRRRQVKRRLGLAWLDGDPQSGWRRRKGRVKEGYLDERRAHVAMARVIEEHEEDLRLGPTDTRVCFSDAAAAWLEYVEFEKRVKPSTLVDHRIIVRTISRDLGPRKLASISTADVSRYLSRLDRSGKSGRTVNKYRQILRSIFEYARRQDAFGLRHNPVDDTEKRREAAPQPVDTFELEEIAAIVRAAHEGLHRTRAEGNYSEATNEEWQRMNDQDAAIFIVAAFTGLRLGELGALRWGDVDFASSRLVVARAMSGGEEAMSTKSGRFRIVPLADQVAAELDQLSRRGRFVERTDFVFCRPDGGPLDRTAVRKRFRRAQEEAGIRPRRFHDLRHTFGSLAIRSFDPVAVQAMMGHARLTTTERYLHSKPRTGDAARLSEAFATGPSAPMSLDRSANVAP
jgi:integrase